MEQPTNPLDNQNPPNDPLLDALEQSIENPQDFADPVAKHEQQLMDDLARQLDTVEASIEDTTPLTSESDVVMGGDESGILADEFPSEASSAQEEDEPPEILDDQDSTPSDSEDPSTSTARPLQPHQKPPRRGGGGRQRKRGLPFGRRIPRLSGRTATGRNWNIRLCPERRERIDETECKSCEKYRHWPDATDEEPRECWYDWQGKPPTDKSDEEGDDTGEEH